MADSDDGPHRASVSGPADRAAAWERAAAAVLTKQGRAAAGASVAGTLSVSTLDGVVVPALGVGSRAVADPGRPPYLRGTPARLAAAGWDVRAAVVDRDPARAAAAALDDLANGVTSLWIQLGGNGSAVTDLPRVLAGVYLDLAPVVVQAGGELTSLQAARALAEALRDTGTGGAPHPDTNLGADPVGEAVRAGTATGPAVSSGVAELAEVVELGLDLGVRAVVVDGTVAHDAGAAEAGELGYGLAVGVAYLRRIVDTGLSLQAALPLLEFRYAATADQFLTIAKLRAARLLWHRVAEVAGVPGGAQRQHAVTSWPMMTRYDPYTNLLRTTVAAFAAGAGGADAITARPFDAALGVPDDLGRRMARNVSALLLDESHVAASVDPAGGSPAVEQLTVDLAAAGWAEFQRLEAAGGIVRALSDGVPQAGWTATADRRAERVATRRQPITGVSEFPQSGELLLTRTPYRHPESAGWAGAFERMRDEPAGLLSLVVLGSVASAGPRVAFVRNALAAGGVEVAEILPAATDSDVLAGFDGSPVVCVAGSDATYRTDGGAVIEALRGAGARWVVFAGRPGAELASLVDDSIAAGDDVVAFLHRLRGRLTSASKALPASAAPGATR